MAKFTLLLLSVLSASIVFSQQVTFDDLLKMNAEKASDAGQYLPQKKKWVEHLQSETNGDSAIVILKSEFNKPEKSNHWVSIYSENDKPKSISYQTTKKMYVDKIVTDLKSAGYILTGSKITDKSKMLIYSKENIHIEVQTLFDETAPGTYYLVTLNS